MFAGTIRRRPGGPCSKNSWAVRGLAALGTRRAVICCRAHERLANSAPMISGVLEKTIARRNPSRCKMRSKRSSKLTPQNSVNASGASAITIGRIFSIVREINGAAASCQLSATSRAARVAGVDQAVFHFMNPIAGFGDDRIMGGKEQGFPALLYDGLQQLKGAFRVGSIEVAGWFVGQNDSRVVGQRAGDGHSLLFASGEMTARSPQFVTQANRFQQAGSAFAHLAIGKFPKLAHRDHHVFLRGEILPQKMESKNEADELAAFIREFVIAQLGDWLRFD